MRELAAVGTPNESCSEQQRDAGGTTVELQVGQLAVGQQWTAGDSNREGGRSREVIVELQLGSSSKEKTVILGQVAAAEKTQWHCSRWQQ